MSEQVDRLVRIARELADGPAPGDEVIFDGPQNSVRVWTDSSAQPQYQLKGYWPASEIAGQSDEQLRALLQSWPRRQGAHSAQS